MPKHTILTVDVKTYPGETPYRTSSEQQGVEYQTILRRTDRRSTDKDDKRDLRRAIRNGGVLMRPHYANSVEARVFPYSYTVNSVYRGSYTWERKTSVKDFNIYAKIPDVHKNVPSFDHKYNRDELLTLVFAQANEREVDVLTALAELPETLEMFRDLGRALVNPRKAGLSFLQAYKRELKNGGGKRATAKAVDHLSSAWLQYRYGIMPVYYQYQELQEQLNRQVKLFESSRKSDRSNIDLTETVRLRHLPGFIDSNQALVLNRTLSGDSKLSALLRRGYDLKSIDSKRFGFNPVQTMWELTTLSFVVDWFVHVGDYISAMTPTCSTSQGWTSSQKIVLIDRFSVISSESTSSWTSEISAPKEVIYERKEQLYDRNAGEGSPTFTIPVGLQMNLKRTLDGFALSWGPLRRLLTKR